MLQIPLERQLYFELLFRSCMFPHNMKMVAKKATVRSNKKRPIPFCDIFKSNKPILMIFTGCIENIFNFFLKNFGGRNFYPRRNFYEKPTNDFFENIKKAPYDVKKYFFSELAPN